MARLKNRTFRSDVQGISRSASRVLNKPFRHLVRVRQTFSPSPRASKRRKNTSNLILSKLTEKRLLFSALSWINNVTVLSYVANEIDKSVV